ncbi:MAG TPA: MFS transporter [Rickettsiales bacterium]|nr:MFS transporter [Rickettsiales bacterium]
MNDTVKHYDEKSVAMGILLALSFSHFLNDMIQSLLPSIYPILKNSFSLNFTQIGLITLTYQLTASLLQPMIGLYTDKRPKPYSLPFGMGLTLSGLLTLSMAGHFYTILLGAALVGSGSSVFHPESSRMARAASGGRHGFAQSFFQVGGNAGTAFGPLIAAYVILPHGQHSIAWFSFAALAAIGVLTFASRWYHTHHVRTGRAKASAAQPLAFSRGRIIGAIAVLMLLMFSKFFYLASINNYYTFYLMHKFGVSVQDSQFYLFIFLGAVAIGTLSGGHIGDLIGRKRVIWGSILGVLPFTLMLPHADLTWTIVLSFVIGVIIASAFSAIIVYAQELIPGKPGTIAGLFFGFAFGMGGLGAALLGRLADATSITYVYGLCAWLPALGLLTVFLPDTKHRKV